jgi:hypothetical protein
VNCARCHDHKFDPIPTEDYYALYGFFQSTRYPWPGIELSQAPYDLVPLVPADQAEPVLQKRQEKQAALQAEYKRLTQEKAAAVKALKEPAQADVDEAKRKIEKLTKAAESAKKALDQLARVPLPFETAYAVADSPKKLGNARIQLRGDPEKPGKEVPRRVLTVLGGRALPADAKGSGRLELADWLTDPDNPLTARVMVNRIWQHHFGRGLVPTPSDFGKQGRPPSHPELLDYLARQFVASGWSVKATHRLLMLSQTYQMASRDDERNAKLDPDNELHWRFDRSRLDAESIRDALLAVSGTLDRSVGGPHPFPDVAAWDFTQHKPFKAVYDTDRRSVYLMTQRIQRHPYLALFDGADPNASTAVRITSTTPLQALYLMNDPFIHEQARRFAVRLTADSCRDEERIDRAYLLAYGRLASCEERTAGMDFLSRVRERLRQVGHSPERDRAEAWESFCRAILLANEFMYVK